MGEHQQFPVKFVLNFCRATDRDSDCGFRVRLSTMLFYCLIISHHFKSTISGEC